MDWGLAREAGSGRAAAARPCETALAIELTPSERAADTGAQVGDDTEQSRMGEALGTPGFMPPEQARGEWDRVDARADVFALGGILCVILTGKPPYTGRTALDVIRRATAADLGDAFARLNSCGADPELIAVAKRCLAPDPAHRYRDGATVVAALQAHRLNGEERGRTAATERAVAVTKTAEARTRAAALAAAQRLSEDRVREATLQATRRAEEDRARAAQRHWGITMLIVLTVVVVMGVYQDLCDRRARPEPAHSETKGANPATSTRGPETSPQGSGH